MLQCVSGVPRCDWVSRMAVAGVTPRNTMKPLGLLYIFPNTMDYRGVHGGDGKNTGVVLGVARRSHLRI